MVKHQKRGLTYGVMGSLHCPFVKFSNVIFCYAVSSVSCLSGIDNNDREREGGREGGWRKRCKGARLVELSIACRELSPFIAGVEN